MSAVTNLNSSILSSGHLRPFDVRRDLHQVADLVEQCFSDTLDLDGQHYLGQMRAAANNPAYLRWAGAAAERVSLPLSGYVWEEDGQIIGNLTLIPFRTQGKYYYLIANVAVRPDYRRQGIARNLTARAIDHARRRGASAVWLHVREENSGAIRLYQALGFLERTRRTTWQSEIRLEANLPLERTPAEQNIKVMPRQPGNWPSQQAWLSQVYPSEITWHLSINIKALRPGLLGAFYRFFSENHIRQWSAYRGNELLGVLAFQASHSYADTLWLACRPEDEPAATKELLLYARQHLSPRRALALDYPAGRSVSAIQEAGFFIHQTLIWMEIPFR
jgi:ribosomal protein S18 acetylase RimI-like enzyme